MSQIRLYFLIGLFLPALSLTAQISRGGSPMELTQFKSAETTMDQVTMPAFEQPSPESTYAEIKRSKYKTLKFGHTFNVSLNTHNSGTWYTTTEGTRVWKLRIKSANAKSLNVILSKFEVPEGAMLFVYNPDKSSIRGGFNSLNQKESGVLPIMPVLGDELIIEYQEPANAAFDANIEVGSVNHDYVGILSKYKLGYFGDSEFCEVNVSCGSNVDFYQRAVLKMIVGGVELCSGSLINNTARDAKPYVLSAAHCFTKVSNKANTTVFIFNYQCPYCNAANIEGTREQSVAGATMRAFSPTAADQDLDFALMELSVSPPDAYRPVFLGWNRSISAPISTYVMHHPLGDVKKISKDNDPSVITTLKVSTKNFYPNGHFRVDKYESGATEPGSSGSSLINPNNQIVGALSAGLADCSDPVYDFYYRFAKAWDTYPEANKQLKTWLDPANTGEENIEAIESNAVKKTLLFTHMLASDQRDIVTLTGAESGYMAGHNSLGYTCIAEKFTVEDIYTLKGVYFVPKIGKYRGSGKLILKIWSGNEQPDSLLYENEVLIKEWRWNETIGTGNFGQTGGYSTKYVFSDKQNYIPLVRDDVDVWGNFFVGFEIKYPAGGSDTLAIYQTNVNANQELNTAFYYTGSEWKPFTSFPGQGASAKLWIDVVAQKKIGVGTSNMPIEKQRFNVYPNPVVGKKVQIDISDTLSKDTKYRVYSSSGILMTSGIIPPELNHFTIDLDGLNEGIYMIAFTDNQQTKAVKISLLDH